MFAVRYFGTRYYPPHYFGKVGAAGTTDGHYFGQRYFGQVYFPNVWFTRDRNPPSGGGGGGGFSIFGGAIVTGGRPDGWL